MVGVRPVTGPRNLRPLLILLIVAAALRLSAAVVVQATVDRRGGSVCLIPGDADGYWELGQKLATGQDYALYSPPRYVLRMPGLPLILAGVQQVSGESVIAARLVLGLLGVAAVCMTYWLGKELGGDLVGLVAGALVAVSPTQIVFSVLLLSEGPFAFWQMLSLWGSWHVLKSAVWTPERMQPAALDGEQNAVVVDPSERQSGQTITRPAWWCLMLAGVWVVAAAYFRPTWAAWGPVLCALILLRAGWQSWASIRKGFVAVAWVVLGASIALAPWVARNAWVTGRFVPTTLWVGPSLYDGLRDDANGDSDMTFYDRENLLATMDEYAVDREYRQRAWAWAWAHPGRTAELALQKLARTWSVWPNAGQFSQGANAVAGWYVLLFALTAVGLWQVVPFRLLTPVRKADPSDRWVALLVILGPALLFSAVHMVFVGSIRYRLPSELPLGVLAAIGLVGLVQRGSLGGSLGDRGVFER